MVKSGKPKRKRKPNAMKMVFPKEAFEPNIRDMVIDDMYMACIESADKRKLRDYVV